MSFGFVYVLRNESMPGIYKVGFTFRSPSLRARELSAATGVPTHFQLVCYGEYEDARDVEAEMHSRLADQRVSESREFFYGPLANIVHVLQSWMGAESFCEHDSTYFIHKDDCRVDDAGIRPSIELKQFLYEEDHGSHSQH